jgi:predicted signal transduction protein with EAL and GGDEF domain
MSLLTLWQRLWLNAVAMVDARQGPDESLLDALTGLPGLDLARARLAEWLAASPDATGEHCVHGLLVGLRRFDAVNLAYGSAAGDAALARVAARMIQFAADELDGAWLVTRGGGGNFLLVANQPCSRERWELFAEQLADAIAQPIAVPAGVLRLSPRMALMRGNPGEGVDTMLDRLGQALTDAKESPARRLAWADGAVVRQGRTFAELEADLLGAIDRDEIEILFQPQFALPGDTLSGGEALARWKHGSIGQIGAAALFAIAERADHVAPLSRHIARRALEAARDWPSHLRLSLNVTPADLALGRYPVELVKTVQKIGFDPQCLTLEVTEQALLHDIQLAARTMEELSGHGIRIALDDFGAGFCNFRYLKVLPLDYLKLDRSMLDGITADARDLAVLRAIIAMARALDLDVIAEGIETEAQRDLIAREGCTFYQGFLRAKPMTPEEFAGLAQA